MTKPNESLFAALVPPAAPSATVQDSIRHLQTQFATTGLLRAGDINRVLGSPTTGVEMALRDSPAQSAKLSW